MKKKGIVFTITTILLLASIGVLSSAYLVRNRELQRMTKISLAGDKLRYLEDDITNSIYSDMLSLPMISVSRGQFFTVFFNHTNLSSSINYQQKVQEYKNFIEGKYSRLQNLNIALSGFNNSFSITPYNGTFIIDTDAVYVYTGNLPALNRTSLTIHAKGSILNSSAGHPADTGYTGISVKILHSGGIYDYSASLNPTATNGPFYVMFEDNSSIEINFGKYNDNNGVLRINASGLEADLSSLELMYNLVPEKTAIIGGNISITYPVENITKETTIVIAQET
jgi:hypothetical protein